MLQSCAQRASLTSCEASQSWLPVYYIYAGVTLCRNVACTQGPCQFPLPTLSILQAVTREKLAGLHLCCARQGSAAAAARARAECPESVDLASVMENPAQIGSGLPHLLNRTAAVHARQPQNGLGAAAVPVSKHWLSIMCSGFGSWFSAWHCWLLELGITGSQGQIVAAGCDSTSNCMQALADLHKTRTHRDLKAGNVMLYNWEKCDGPDVTIIDWATSCSHEGTYGATTPIIRA